MSDQTQGKKNNYKARDISTEFESMENQNL